MREFFLDGLVILTRINLSMPFLLCLLGQLALLDNGICRGELVRSQQMYLALIAISYLGNLLLFAFMLD